MYEPTIEEELWLLELEYDLRMIESGKVLKSTRKRMIILLKEKIKSLKEGSESKPDQSKGDPEKPA